MRIRVLLTFAITVLTFSTLNIQGQTIDLPTSKQLIEPAPGEPQRINSLPMTMAVSPDGRYVVTINAGYGTYESKYEQSLAVLDTQTESVVDFPDARMALHTSQTLYSGLAFSLDGSHLYASIGSATDPLGKEPPTKEGVSSTGSGVLVYTFKDGKIEPERMIRLPLQQLAPGRKTRLIGESEGDQGVPFPAAIAVVGLAGAEKLLIADNLSDDVLLIDPASVPFLAGSEVDFVSTWRRVMLCRAPIRSRCSSRRMDGAHSWRYGTPPRLRNWILRKMQSGASWRCSSHRAQLRPARIRAPSRCRRTARRFT